MVKNLTEEMREDLRRLLPKKLNPDKCWLWRGSVDSGGYGIFECASQKFQAHRSAAILFGNRVVLSKMEIYHTCNNPLCCNPRHLRIRDKSNNHSYDCIGIESIIPLDKQEKRYIQYRKL